MKKEANKYFNPPFLFKNKHIATIAPSLFRKIKGVDYKKIRINTPDNDFLDIELSINNSKSLIIIIHGLESNASKAYIKGLVRIMNNANIDALAINLRGCSGEDNRKFYSYHSGKTEDLETVMSYVLGNYSYSEIYLAGFSLGGNLVLKYAGERGDNIHKEIKAVVGISVPCDLKATAENFLRRENFLYQWRFIRSLRKKALKKIIAFPEYKHLEKEIKACRTFFDFDNIVTAPANGFKNAEDYWQQNSCKQFIEKIRIPALLINALDDPFLPEKCYPYKEAEKNPNVNIETPKYGGHVGFINRFLFNKELWHEKRVLDYIINL